MTLFFFSFTGCAIVHTYEAGKAYIQAEELYRQHDFRAALERYQTALSNVENTSSPRWYLVNEKVKKCKKKVIRLAEVEGKIKTALKRVHFITARTYMRVLLDEHLVPDQKRSDIRAQITDLNRRIARRKKRKKSVPSSRIEREAIVQDVERLFKEGDEFVQSGKYLEAEARYQEAHDLLPSDKRAAKKLKDIHASIIRELNRKRLGILKQLHEPFEEANLDSVIAQLEEILEIREYHSPTRESLIDILHRASVFYYSKKLYCVAQKYLEKKKKYASKAEKPEVEKSLKRAQEACDKPE